MGTSADRPYLDIIYKLCETANANGEFTPIMKLSEGKATLPGRKQVFRFKDKKGVYEKDVSPWQTRECRANRCSSKSWKTAK
jgi:nicotinate phosphoribosyltransferase